VPAAVLLTALALIACSRQPTAGAPSGSGAPAAQSSAVAPAAPAASQSAPAAQQAAPAASADSQAAVEEFYRRKTVRILVGYGAGGPYDSFSRIVARHMAQYIPGQPTVIVENKPGAASLVAANLVYNTDTKAPDSPCSSSWAKRVCRSIRCGSIGSAAATRP
jgi:hypothetical protein